MTKHVKKYRGKIATIIILLLLLLPFFWAWVLFRPQNVLGSFDAKLDSPKFGFNLPKIPAPSFLDDTSTDYGNRNKSLNYLDDQNGNPRNQDQPQVLGEAANKELSLGDLKPFNTKLLIRDQKEDAVANTFHRIKSTYDITYGKTTATIFIGRNDPNLPEENAIAISYPIALRLGIIANKTTYVDVVGQLKR
jgi:hypothetical protein